MTSTGDAIAGSAAVGVRSSARRGSRRARRSARLERYVGLALVGTIVLACVLVPLLVDNTADAIVGSPYQPPSTTHWFGTDGIGRDVFVRVFVGGRIDLAAGLVAVVGSMVIGSAIGSLAGASPRRWLDSTVMRVVDGLVAFPFVVLVLALVVIIGYGRTWGPVPAGLPAIVLAIIIVDWTVYARLARNEARLLSTTDYVAAVRLAGLPARRVVGRHILPGVMRVTGSYAVSDVILLIVAIASLSFLGAGVQPPTPEWGAIMYEGRGVLGTAWWVTTMPGIALALTGLGVALIADSFLGEE